MKKSKKIYFYVQVILVCLLLLPLHSTAKNQNTKGQTVQNGAVKKTMHRSNEKASYSSQKQTKTNQQKTNRVPDCSKVDAHPNCLWPPNHKYEDIMQDVFIKGIIDPDGDPINIKIISVTSDEPTTIKGSGGAVHAPDAFIVTNENVDGTETDMVKLRAERAGNSNGRVYEIIFIAYDGEDEVEGAVQVVVPHDKSKNCEAIDDGQIYDATAFN